MSRYPTFDRSRLLIKPLAERVHDLHLDGDPGYYFRPQKTILVRTVADGGESFYFCGEHRATLPTLWRRLTKS